MLSMSLSCILFSELLNLMQISMENMIVKKLAPIRTGPGQTTNLVSQTVSVSRLTNHNERPNVLVLMLEPAVHHQQPEAHHHHEEATRYQEQDQFSINNTINMLAV